MASSQQPSPRSNKDELSFGVELEFLFYYKTSEDSDTRPEHDPLYPDTTEVSVDPDDENKFPRPIVPPPHIAQMSYAGHREWAQRQVEETILSVRGAKLAEQAPPPQFSEDSRSMYVITDDYALNSGWKVTHDGSVGDAWLTVRGYEAVEFEVVSPALWDRPKSHRHVHHVVRQLARKFRLRVNLTCGFHVHVGAGLAPPRDKRVEPLPRPDAAEPDKWNKLSDGGGSDASSQDHIQGQRHSLGVLKRAAALMWAADGFLCHAHPPERGVAYFSPPIRFCSRLARGLELCYADEGAGFTRRIDKRLDFSSASPNKPDSKWLVQDPLPSYSFPRLYDNQRFPALRPERLLDEEAAKRFETMGDQREVRDLDKVDIKTVLLGVTHIMNRKNRGEVAELFSRPEDSAAYYRLNYNFKKYLSANGGGVDNTQTGTLEFREATGTMDPQWVSVWSSICLGLFRFARDASDTRFWAVINQLAVAELVARGKSPVQEKRPYDMISLLFDLGLFAEGLYLESKLREDPVRFWYPNRLGRTRGDAYSDGGSNQAKPKNSQSDESPSAESSSFVQSPVAGPSKVDKLPSQEPQHRVATSDPGVDRGSKDGETPQKSAEGNKTSMSWCQSHEDCPLVGK